MSSPPAPHPECAGARAPVSGDIYGRGRGRVRLRRVMAGILTAALVAACGDDEAGGSDGASETESQSAGPSTGANDSEETGSTESETSDAATTGEPEFDPELNCELYCSIYVESCVDHSEYTGEPECLAHCAQWPLGQVTDSGSDSLGCRLYHVSSADIYPGEHCPHAGPSGAKICYDTDNAPTCAAYCQEFFARCDGALNPYADEAECLETCAPWYPGQVGQDANHSIACRLTHASLAEGDPATHCPAAGPDGAGVCVLP